MLAEFYEKYSKYFNDTLNTLIPLSSLINESTDASVMEEFQNQLILFGNNLEEQYCQYDSSLITGLEKSCEYLYQFSETHNEDALKALKDTLSSLDKESLENIKITDYHTSIVLIAKNEQRYIEEWLEYHLLAGISHFYIYDNESDASFKEILDPYIEKGLVTYISFPGTFMQMKAYDHAIKHFKLETRYMAFIDADEFLVPVSGESIPNVIDNIIDTYMNREYKVDWNPGGIAVNWRCYGPSGHEKEAKGLLIENYKMRANDDYDNNAHIKTICNPRMVQSVCDHPHSFNYKRGYFAISEKGSYVPGAFFYDSKCEHIRLNHYFVKSKEEYAKKWKRGWPDLERTINDKEFVSLFNKLEKECNVITDNIMDKYIPHLKDKLNNNRG